MQWLAAPCLGVFVCRDKYSVKCLRTGRPTLLLICTLCFVYLRIGRIMYFRYLTNDTCWIKYLALQFHCISYCCPIVVIFHCCTEVDIFRVNDWLEIDPICAHFLSQKYSKTCDWQLTWTKILEDCCHLLELNKRLDWEHL